MRVEQAGHTGLDWITDPENAVGGNLMFKNPIVTVQKDGEAAFELSPKRFARQYAATIAQDRLCIDGSCLVVFDLQADDETFAQKMTIPLVKGTLRSASYKKTKVSACGAPGAAED